MIYLVAMVVHLGEYARVRVPSAIGARAAVPACVLDPLRGALPLGWTTWLCTAPATADADDFHARVLCRAFLELEDHL